MLGFIVGIFASIMGVGGAFLMVPAMIYIIGMPTKLVPGTSLFCNHFYYSFCSNWSCPSISNYRFYFSFIL